MAEPYLRELQSIVERVYMRRDQADAVSCKHFFSGAAAYVDGHMFMTLTTVGLALKLPEDDRNTLFGQSQLIDDDGVLNDWISRSIKFVRA